MWPAWLAGRIRPGIRPATAADATRLRELTPLIGTLALPILAVALPLLLQLGHLARGGPWTYVLDIDPWTLQIYDVFTESIPFMLAAAAIGLAAPAAGVVIVLVYAVGDLVVTAMTGELQPLPGALLGRLVADALLWLLVVEIPILGRQVFEWAVGARGSGVRKVTALAIASVATGGLIYVWGHGARLLVGAVFYPTGTGLTPPPVFVVLLEAGLLLAIGVGVACAGVFAVRYFGAQPHPGRVDLEPPPLLGEGNVVRYLASGLVTLFILMALYDQPIDAAILIVGVLAARPVARTLLIVTRTARLLTRIPWAIRLVVGFAVTFALAAAFLQVVGILSFSRLGSMVIAVAIGLVTMEFFLAADEVAGARPAGAARATAEGIVIGAILLLALPMAVFAHDGEAAVDAAGAAAVAGGAALAAAARRRPQFYRSRPSWDGPGGDGVPPVGRDRRAPPQPDPRASHLPRPPAMDWDGPRD
jgi:hypothetical protein